MTFKLSIKITDPVPVIERRIKTAIANTINIAMRSSVKRIKARADEIIDNSIRQSAEIQSLLGGQLQAELGPTTDKVTDTIDFIIQQIKNSVKIDIKEFSPFGSTMRGYISISIYPRDLVDSLNAYSSAVFLTKEGTQIPWLKWLTTLGDRIIVRNYTVDFLHTRGSRTGQAIMKETKKRGWRVPPQFSGTKTKNFITRALDDYADLVMYYLKLEFTRSL